MRIELRKKKSCPTCGRLELKPFIVVTCNTCEKDITELYKNSSNQAHETWITYNNNKSDKKHYCNWTCFKNDMIKILNNEYLMGKFDNLYIPNMHKKSFEDFVNIILLKKSYNFNSPSLEDVKQIIKEKEKKRTDKKAEITKGVRETLESMSKTKKVLENEDNKTE